MTTIAMNLGLHSDGVKGHGRVRALILVSSLVAAFLLPGFLGSFTGVTAATAPALYYVQVSIQTTSSLPDYYVVSAYNSTGALVTTSQNQYPAGSLAVPAGSYIFTASAVEQSSYYQPYPVYYSGSVASGAPSASSSGASVCCVYKQPVVEYGYAVQTVSGSMSLTIPTKNMNATSTSAITIQASYPNGTAAEGASISASVVGNSYWWGSDSKVSMYNSTDAGGSATLVAPDVPLLLSVWASLPVELPTNQTTVQRTIAGEAVNVTVYWQPTYVSFAGWSLLTPPQTSAKVILHYQQPMYYVTAYSGSALTKDGVAILGSSGAPSASSEAGQASVVFPGFGPGGISQPPAQTRSTAQTVYLSTAGGGTTSIPGPDNTLLLAAVGVAVALAAISLVTVAVRSRKIRY